MDNFIPNLPNFEGKAVIFYVAHLPMEYAVTLDSPTFQDQAGRLFVGGGLISAESNDWAKGAEVCVAWDQVSQYMVFDSADEFRQRTSGNQVGFLGMFRR